MNEFDKLSERQRKMLVFIDGFMRKNGFPPTIRDIGDATATPSTSVVNYNLNKLVGEGWLEREQGVSRGIRLKRALPNSDGKMVRGGNNGVRTAPTVHVMLYGAIVAGEPIPVPDDYQPDELDAVEVTETMLCGANPSEVFALRVRGDSMVDAMVRDGDVVLFRKTDVARRGEMVAVWLAERGETTLKYFFPEGEHVRLQPAHPFMEPIVVDAAQCQVRGRVVSVLRRLA